MRAGAAFLQWLTTEPDGTTGASTGEGREEISLRYIDETIHARNFPFDMGLTYTRF